jgi:recombination protein RecT
MLKDGASQYEVMTKAEIEEVRQSSKSANNGPWQTWWSEMAKKSVLKRLVKYLPMSAALAKAVTADNAAENDDVFDVDSVELPELDAVPRETATDELTRKLENMGTKE